MMARMLFSSTSTATLVSSFHGRSLARSSLRPPQPPSFLLSMAAHAHSHFCPTVGQHVSRRVVAKWIGDCQREGGRCQGRSTAPTPQQAARRRAALPMIVHPPNQQASVVVNLQLLVVLHRLCAACVAPHCLDGEVGTLCGSTLVRHSMTSYVFQHRCAFITARVVCHATRAVKLPH
jgi:hypothetical protein